MQNTEARKQFDQRCLKFGAAILRLVKLLPKDASGRHVANQLMRSGTSVGANLREAQAAQSRAEFIHKISLSFKESNESSYWLELLIEADMYTGVQPRILVTESREITAILAKSVLTARANGNAIGAAGL